MTELQQKVMSHLNAHDTFCLENNIQLTAVGDDEATARMIVAPRHMNASGVIQGGAIFALCDLAFAGVANARGERTVAQGASISYLRPGSGKKLVATGRMIRRGKRAAVVAVEVVNDAGKLVACATVTGCPLGVPLLEEEHAE